MADRKYFVICDDNCKFEGMTKEQIITAIEQAISTGNITDVDAGFITKIKEQNKQLDLSFWVGTQEEYNAIETKKDNCFYIINNSGNISELKATVDNIKKQIDLMNTGIDAFTDDVKATMENQNSLINKFINEHITIVEEYHEDKVHYYRFSNGLEIELGELQKIIPYSNNSYGFELKKIAEDDLISFNISLSSSECVRASEDYLRGNRIVVVLRSISQDGTINDTQTSVGVVYGSYIAFGLSGLGVVSKGVN